MKDNSGQNSLSRLIALTKADGGKFYVIDESGEPALVIMGIDEYEQLLLRKVQGQLGDIEEINKKIAEVQAGEQEQLDEQGKLTAKQQAQEDLVSEVIDSTFSFETENQLRAELEDI
ncbi:hypothetical protein KGQ24_03890 [Patescibacteria group bacterium]|nr:hypothetical protein [Patescibacteria group bacterium]